MALFCCAMGKRKHPDLFSVEAVEWHFRRAWKNGEFMKSLDGRTRIAKAMVETRELCYRHLGGRENVSFFEALLVDELAFIARIVLPSYPGKYASTCIGKDKVDPPPAAITVNYNIWARRAGDIIKTLGLRPRRIEKEIDLKTYLAEASANRNEASVGGEGVS